MPIGATPRSRSGRSGVRASRSSGPGGQHANITASRVEACSTSRVGALTDEQKRLMIARCGRAGNRGGPGRAQSGAQPRARARATPAAADGALDRPAPRRATVRPRPAPPAARRQAPAVRAKARTPPAGARLMRWYVDGMNVIGTRPDGWWRDRDAAMLRLVDVLERWAAGGGRGRDRRVRAPASPPIRSTVIEVAARAEAQARRRRRRDRPAVARRAEPGAGPGRHLGPVARRPGVGRRGHGRRVRDSFRRGSRRW